MSIGLQKNKPSVKNNFNFFLANQIFVLYAQRFDVFRLILFKRFPATRTFIQPFLRALSLDFLAFSLALYLAVLFFFIAISKNFNRIRHFI